MSLTSKLFLDEATRMVVDIIGGGGGGNILLLLAVRYIINIGCNVSLFIIPTQYITCTPPPSLRIVGDANPTCEVSKP
jgi:hypothetical protein